MNDEDKPIIVQKSFKVGSYYRHALGQYMAIVGSAFTSQYGWCLIGEQPGVSDLRPVGTDPTHAMGWKEITHEKWIEAIACEASDRFAQGCALANAFQLEDYVDECYGGQPKRCAGEGPACQGGGCFGACGCGQESIPEVAREQHT